MASKSGGLVRHHHEKAYQAPSTPLRVNVLVGGGGTSDGGSTGLTGGSTKTSPSSAGGGGGGVSEGTTASAGAVHADSSFNEEDIMQASPSITCGSPSPMLIDTSQSTQPHNTSYGTESTTSQSPMARTEVAESNAKNLVVMRKRVGYKCHSSKRISEPGGMLKLALQRYFSDPNQGSRDLDEYILQVFHQLDYHCSNTISREDFETLCEVLGILDIKGASISANNGSSAYRHSGLEWLASYRPRPNSPISPLRYEKLSDIKFNKAASNWNERNKGHLHCPSDLTKKKTQDETDSSSPPNFLFTLGPRPFWEMWPQKKKRKKRLSVDEFKRSLLEQWARFNRLPPSRVSQIFSPVYTPTRKSYPNEDLITVLPLERFNGSHARNRETNTAKESTRTKRLMRRVAKITKRYQVMDKLSKRLGFDQAERKSAATAVNGDESSKFTFFKRKKRKRRRNVTISAPLQVSRSPESPTKKQPSAIPTSSKSTVARADAGLLHVKDSKSGSLDRKNRIDYLERQVMIHQQEIGNLRHVIQDLRSSLQLSDAQNLALQVLLKKMSKAEIHYGSKPTGPAVNSSLTTGDPLIQNNLAGEKRTIPKNANLIRAVEEPNDRVDAKKEPSPTDTSSMRAFRHEMNESEKQLEKLVRELKEMSQTIYPSTNYLMNSSSHNQNSNTASSSGHSTFNGGGLGYQDFGPFMGTEEEQLIHNTSRELNKTKEQLASTQSELQEACVKLKEKEQQIERNSMSLNEAYASLERAQKQLNVMRYVLQSSASS